VRRSSSPSSASLEIVREAWSSRAGFVLASIGSAVGIGNLWRFPYVVGTSGGGAFLLPYLIAVGLFALPLMILEFSLGRRFRSSVVPAFAGMHPRLRWLGFGLVFVQTMILAYDLVVTGWILAYFLAFAGGAPMTFAEFTGSYVPLWFFLLAGGLCFLVVQSGVRGGLERLCNVLMPALFAMLGALVATALALPGAGRGVAFYLTPDLRRLADPLVWTAAFGQAFFSLGVGSGVMLTYGSYLRRGDVVRSAVLITAADLVVAVLGGLIVFPVVFSFGYDPAAGVQLAFVTLPRIFEEMGFGLLFGSIFFLVLFFAALTSAVSILELPVATLIDVWGISRRSAAASVTAVVTLLGLPSALSYTALRLELFGVPLLDLKDFAFGTVGMTLGALALSVAAGWFVDEAVLREAVGDRPRLVRLFLAALRFFIPAVLALNLAARTLMGV
jgi:NSS family neurotransmitter:Na+ symporter